ncbi:quinone oxidoreductase family protein [Bradyrhizobium sp.]|jgi:NADPH2:quinone reductase|uniref:quinone oxidoreductase family protein n=1 Tax=Bradyrhizobium sp. TaxID=376 RepID=UPI003D14D1FA
MTTMKALRFGKYGPPSVLSIQELPVPDIKMGEALVELHASAINPSDVKNVAGAFKAALPRIPGRDFAGVVVAGDGWKGREVWGSGAGFGVWRDGTHAQYVVVSADGLSEKPAHLSMEEASTVGVPYLAAWSGLVDAANIQAGETVLITGALGAVGRAATQIAHWKKAKVIGADISDKPSDVDVFVNTKAKELPVEVKALTNGKGADLVFDAVGGPMFEPCLKSLRLGGRQVAITSIGNGRVEFSLIDFYHNRLHLMGVDTVKLTGPAIAGIMDQLRAGFEGGHLRTSPVQKWSLDQATDAYTAVEEGIGLNKHVFLPHGN